MRAAYRRQEGWVHIAASYYHDVEPCLKKKVPVIWVNREQAAARARAEEARRRSRESAGSGQAPSASADPAVGGGGRGYVS